MKWHSTKTVTDQSIVASNVFQNMQYVFMFLVKLAAVFQAVKIEFLNTQLVLSHSKTYEIASVIIAKCIATAAIIAI